MLHCDVRLDCQLQKMMRLRGKGLTEEDQKDSGGEQKDEDEGLGPRSNVSLLDQHQHLKEKAEGSVDVWSVCGCSLSKHWWEALKMSPWILALRNWVLSCLLVRLFFFLLLILGLDYWLFMNWVIFCSPEGVGKGKAAEGGGEDSRKCGWGSRWVLSLRLYKCYKTFGRLQEIEYTCKKNM